jgi:hypothetical protein
MQAKAQMLQQAQQETEMMAQEYGVDLTSNPKDYYKLAGMTLQKYGLVDEAQNVMTIAQNHDIVERKMKVDEGGLQAQTLAAQAAYLKASADKQTTNKSILTLVPPGTDLKTGTGAKTFNLSDPDQAAKAAELMNSGYIDLSKLPAPPTPPNSITVMPPQERNWKEKMADKVAEDTYGLYKTTQAVPQVLDKAARTLAILEDPNLIVGPGADIRIAIAKGLNVLGADNAETITNTDNLFTNLADTTLSMIESSGLGTGQGFTQNDRDYLEKARAGRLAMTKESIAEVARRTIKGQRFYLENWNKRIAALPEERRNDLRGLGVTTDPLPLPEIPSAKKYRTSKEIKENVPAGVRPDVWNVMTPEQKALFK